MQLIKSSGHSLLSGVTRSKTAVELKTHFLTLSRHLSRAPSSSPQAPRHLSGTSLPCHQRVPAGIRCSLSPPGASYSNQTFAATPPRVFVGYTIYKGKAALSMKPIKPQFRPAPGGFKLIREGCLMLEFAPSVGLRTYDWSRKQIFSLSVAEIGTVVALSPSDKVQFYHDPNKGRQDEGRVRKTLSIEPSNDGFYFNFNVKDDIQGISDRLNVPVLKSEFAIMCNAMNYIMPYLMGWNAFVNPSIVDQSLMEAGSFVPSPPLQATPSEF